MSTVIRHRLRNIELLLNMADRATRGAKPAISYFLCIKGKLI